MKKIFYIFLILLNISLIISGYNNFDDDNIEYPYDDDIEEGINVDDDSFFTEGLQKYLVEKNLFESEKLVEPDELKQIFIDVMAEGGIETYPENFQNIYRQLADHFIELYYNEKKQIRGKDIYGLFNINDIYTKFGELIGDNNYYDDYNETSDDLDDMNMFGDRRYDL